MTEIPPERFFFGQLIDYWRVLAIKAACELGLPDRFGDEPRSAADVAREAGLNGDATFRLLRALADAGVFQHLGSDTFAANDRSRLLRSDSPLSFKWMVLSEFGSERVPAWMDLPETIRTGGIAWDRAYGGEDIWSFYRKHPAEGANFAKWMTGASHAMTRAIIDSFDFSPYRTIVDVGGGQGAFVSAVLHQSPSSTGILFDSPGVIETAPVGDRIRQVAGDFFESVPSGGDLYTLKWVIHDWDDEKAARIYRNIREAMNPGGKLMVIETVVGENGTAEGPDVVKWMDINMMVMTGGRERTEAEHRNLLRDAGFHLAQVIPTSDLPRLLLAHRA